MSAAPAASGMLASLYFDFGFRYFVAGRFAAAERLNPVAANLLHHAIAMFLLAGVCARSTDEERKALDNNLNRIWNFFKNKLDPTNDLGRFDELVTTLHEFENVSPSKTMVRKASSELVFDEIEALIKAICGASGIHKAKPNFSATGTMKVTRQ